MIRILKNSPDVTAGMKEFILQPQSEIARVRAFLLEEGFLFIREDMVLEDGKFYPMMKVRTFGERNSHSNAGVMWRSDTENTCWRDAIPC